jgi:DNA-binding transcriptional LysR family regulator
MDLTHLRYFRTIADCGSLTAAARALRVSQPTLTVAMQQLEQKLETTLLLRERTGVRLTTTGEELLRHAIEILALVERAEQSIRGLETDDVGRFVIGCHESLGAYFLPEFMVSFVREAPRLELTMWNGPSAEVLRAVVDNKVHFGLVVNPQPHPDVVLVELFHDAVDVFVAADAEISPQSHRIRRGGGPPRSSRVRTMEAARALLRGGPLVYTARVPQCQELLQQLGRAGLLPDRLLPSGDFELVKSLAIAGIGVALLPRRVAAQGTGGALVRLHPDLPYVPDVIALVYRADMHRTRAAMRLKDALVRHGKAMDEPLQAVESRA